MITATKNNIAILNQLINKNYSFAVWRTPGEEIRFLMQTGDNPTTLDSYNKLEQTKGFVLAPFKVSTTFPIVVIRPDVTSLPSYSEVENLPALQSQYLYSEKIYQAADIERRRNYNQVFDKFLDALRKEEYEKLVLSREEYIIRDSEFSAVMTFFKAAKNYPRAFVYLAYTPQSGLWLGASPEILLSGSQDKFHTVALAGTLPINNGIMPQEWDKKNCREQRLVSEYIHDQLSALDIEIEESPVYVAQAGTIAHLKSDFDFNVPSSGSFGEILSRLHPTPAVCGITKEKAYRFIIENEGYERSYYSGFIGYIDLSSKTELYVNLRCMQITPTYLKLFAGGGILSNSKVDTEWQETESKMQTIKTLLI